MSLNSIICVNACFARIDIYVFVSYLMREVHVL